MPKFDFNTVRAAALGVMLGATGLVAAPAPAQADDRQAAGIIAGIIALGIIARALDDDEPHVTQHYSHQPRYDQPLQRPYGRFRDHPHQRHTRERPHFGQIHDRPRRNQWRQPPVHQQPAWPTPQYLAGQTNHPSVASPNH